MKNATRHSASCLRTSIRSSRHPKRLHSRLSRIIRLSTRCVLSDLFVLFDRSEADFPAQVELIFPQEFAPAWESVRSKLRQLQYIRVILSLSALLEDDFFNTFIKAGVLTFLSRVICRDPNSAGNLLMLSEGRPGVDNVFSLHNGRIGCYLFFFRLLT